MAVGKQRRTQRPLSQLEQSQHTEALHLSHHAERSLQQLRKDAVIRRKNAIRAANTGQPKLETKKSVLNICERSLIDNK